jgi:hypothetical protein
MFNQVLNAQQVCRVSHVNVFVGGILCYVPESGSLVGEKENIIET